MNKSSELLIKKTENDIKEAHRSVKSLENKIAKLQIQKGDV